MTARRHRRLSMFFFAPLFLIPPLFLFTSGGTSDSPLSTGTTKSESFTISVQSEAFPGDCLSVLISSRENLDAADAVLADATGKIIARVKSFETSDFERRFMIGLSPSLESGDYSLEITATSSMSAPSSPSMQKSFTVTILPRDFPNEEIFLDAQNTAIKNDYGPVRMAQIDALNEILFRQDPLSPRFNGPYAQPVTATRRTSAYGDRRTYRYPNGKKESSVHWGIDFGIPTGTPVFAAGDGRVVMAENRISTGLTVVIEHLPGVYSLYYHLDSLTCAKDEIIRTGTLIGKSGSTGLSTGPHLHWEFRVNGIAVSPDWFTGTSLWNSAI